MSLPHPFRDSEQPASRKRRRAYTRPILAIDTALGNCSAALYDAEAGEVLALESREMSRGHAEALMPMIDQVMQAAEKNFYALDRVVTTVGPGSFTGLRVGIAAARGISLACERPAVGVSTLQALTMPHVSEDDTVPIVAAVDARHGNVYLQMVGAGGRMLVPPRLVSVAEAIGSIATGLVRIAGSGAQILAAHWPAADVPAPIIVDSRPGPDIVWVARIGAGLDPERSPPQPLYLRAPDARPQDGHRLPRR